MSEIKLERIVRVPIAAIEKPRSSICEVMLDRWWVVDPKAESVIFYKRSKPEHSSPLCNGAQVIVERILRDIWAKFGFEVRLVPVAFIPLWFTGDIDFGYNLKSLLVPDALKEDGK